ncbi:MAG: DUF3472 domain-containing protein [Bacteroidaceae bacterium]|nr:DUF3472 domain-containing protein [Bacteroidaceae bacterium]
MKTYLKFFLAAVMVLSFTALHAQKEITVALGDSVTFTSTNEGIKYAWSLSTDGKTFYTIPDATERTLKVRVFGENYYRVRWTNADNKSTYADTVKVVMPAYNYALKNYSVTAGQGYVEVDGKDGSGISIPYQKTIEGNSNKLGVTEKLTNWSNANAHAAYFINTPAGIVNLKMNVTFRKNCMAQFRMRVYDTDTPDSLIAENIISFNGTGEPIEIPVITFKLGKPGYHKYDLECIRGNTNVESINKWIFDLEQNVEPFSPTILMSPSIHIMGWTSSNPKLPSGDAFDWAYEEVKIPGGDSIVNAIYVMSLGVLAGYMGIQVGADGAHRTVLFSQWDSGDTDTDPNLPDHLRSTAVDTGDGVIAQRFGGEGTGVQSFRNNGAFWDFNKYVQFITHCRNELATYETVENGKTVTKQQRNMLISAWWNAQDEKGWQYMSTLRVANRSTFIDSWYSFVECYVNGNGQRKRIGYFRNGYAKARKEQGGKWFHMNKASFGHNNGGTHMGARNDIWQDVDPEDKFAWLMITGGFTNKAHIGTCQVPMRTTHTPVDTINLDLLLAREELAFENERRRLDSISAMNAAMYDKSDWELLSFTSEEKTGEGTNGFAKLIIDNDKETYWHSQWKSSTAKVPHTFVIDMKQELDINAFYFAMSGGEARFQQDITIQGSLDNENWTTIYENNDCPKPVTGKSTGEYVLNMDSTATARYLKLTINKVHTGVNFARINEFSVLKLEVPTLIEDLKADKKVRFYTKGASICVDAPCNMASAKVSVYSADGQIVTSCVTEDVTANDVISVHSFSIVPGIYVVTLEDATGKTYTGKVAVK